MKNLKVDQRSDNSIYITLPSGFVIYIDSSMEEELIHGWSRYSKDEDDLEIDITLTNGLITKGRKQYAAPLTTPDYEEDHFMSGVYPEGALEEDDNASFPIK